MQHPWRFFRFRFTSTPGVQVYTAPLSFNQKPIVNTLRTLFCALLLSPLAAPAWAQNINWRGTIASFDGKALGVSLRDGSVVSVDVPEGLPISATERFSLADVKPGMVLGVTTVQGADGATVAIDVRPIPATAPQGLSAHDLQPQSTMTNAVLEAAVASANAHELVLNYKTGSVKVVVPAGTPMSRAVPGARSDLVVGETVFVVSRRNESQGYTAVRVQVGKNGIKPTQ